MAIIQPTAVILKSYNIIRGDTEKNLLKDAFFFFWLLSLSVLKTFIFPIRDLAYDMKFMVQRKMMGLSIRARELWDEVPLLYHLSFVLILSRDSQLFYSLLSL